MMVESKRALLTAVDLPLHPILTAILIGFLLLAGCAAEDPLTPEERAWLTENDGKLIVNNESGWPPIIDTDTAGNPYGIVYDFQRLIEERLNFTFKLDRPDSWERFMERFRRGETDVNNNLQKNSKRTEFALFTQPYIEIPNAIIVRKEITGALEPDRMQGMTVAVTRDFAIHDHIKKHHGSLKLMPLDDDLQCLLETATRNADAAVVNLAVASYLIEKKGIANLRVAGYADYSNALCFASRKDLPILNRILQKGLDRITQAERDAIFRKWISLGHVPFYRSVRFWMVAGGVIAGVVAILVLVLVWNQSLKQQVRSRTETLETVNAQLQNEVEERKQAEEALRISHERFFTVLNSIDATVYVADMATHEILFMNQNMVERFGRDMTGEICWKAFRKEPGPCPYCTNVRLVDADGNPTGVHVWKDKNPVTGRFYVNHDRAVAWTDGRLVRLQVATDISDLTQMEDQLQQAQKMESIGRLAGGIAHDFNNMLSIISGNTEMILEDVDPRNPIVSGLHEIQKAAQRSADLTRQLLAFARKQTIAPQVLDLNQTVDGMLKMLKRLIGEDIDLVWLPDKNLWPIKMDPSQVDQVLANLCVNARDAIQGVGKITIETGKAGFDDDYCREHQGFVPGDYAMIAVSDNGHGMDRETLDKIFEPFFSTKEVGRGTGLGLSTVYGIAKQNNGFINVYSEPEKGTTLKIYFPRHAEKRPPSRQPETQEANTDSRETILLVEDEKAILRMTTLMLERLGYSVLSASGPVEALRLGASFTGVIDMVITDVVMPEMSGRDMVERLLQSHPDLKCLFMSGYTANVIAHHGILDEGIAFINKPFSKQDLAAKVRAVLGKA